MQQNVLIFFFFCFFGATAKTVLKKFAKSWMKGMAWFERWETRLFLKFILWGTSNMRSDQFCKKKRQIFDIFLFSQRFHICSQAFDMIWFHPSTLTQQHKSLVKIGKSAKGKNLTLVASLIQLWRNCPVKEYFLCAMWHPAWPCCWLGFPVLHSNQPFHFKLFAWWKICCALL